MVTTLCIFLAISVYGRVSKASKLSIDTKYEKSKRETAQDQGVVRLILVETDRGSDGWRPRKNNEDE